jgi:hypothetical protein
VKARFDRILALAGGAALALAVCGASFAEEAKPTRILFVGNSATYWTGIPASLAKAAAATGHPVTVESESFGGFSLEDHWKDGRALAAIDKGWDVVILQQGTSALPESRANLVEYAGRFAVPIRKAGAKPALFMVWPLVNEPRRFPAVIGSYRAAAKAAGGMVLPAGEAWLRALAAEPQLKFYSDNFHPTALGGDLVVLTLWKALFAAGTRGFTEAERKALTEALALRRDQAAVLFDAAANAVESPLDIGE